MLVLPDEMLFDDDDSMTDASSVVGRWLKVLGAVGSRVVTNVMATRRAR